MIPCALARNIETMLVARFLDGVAGSAFLSVAGGTVGDMFARHVSYSLFTARQSTGIRAGAINTDVKQELSAPMMIYSAAPFM
jgi:MFS family permease